MEPLHFPTLSRWESFLLWFPVVGTHHKIIHDIQSTLAARSDDEVTHAWNTVSDRERNVWHTLCDLMTGVYWEQACRFIPEDSFQVVFWDQHGDSDVLFMELMAEIGTRYPRVNGHEAWSVIFSGRDASTMTLRDFIRGLLAHSSETMS